MLVKPLLARPGGEDTCLTKLRSDERTGLIFIIICSFCSLLAVLAIMVSYVRRVLSINRLSSSTWILLRSDIEAYFLSLLFADMIVAVGGIFNLKWVIQGRTSCGALCSTQGGLEQFGTLGISLLTLTIALHTFFVIFFRWTPPRTRVVGISVLASIFTICTLLVLVPALSLSSSEVPFYTPTPAWCYISATHIALRAGAGYAFSWLAGLVSIIVYGLLFFRLRGSLIGSWRDMRRSLAIRGPRLGGRGGNGVGNDRASWRTEDVDSETTRSVNIREARKMLWYPLCYLIIVLPLSATRWNSFTAHLSSSGRHETPFPITAAAASLFKLGGLVDVLLFAYTRPSILFFGAAQGADARDGNPTSEHSGRPSRGSADGPGSNDGIELEMLGRSDAEPRLERRPSGTGGSQTCLLPQVRGSIGGELPDESGLRLGSHDAFPNEIDEQRSEIDLTEELDLYVSPMIPSNGSHRQSVRSPLPPRLELPELPNPRISGLSAFVNRGSLVWMPMQREERTEPALPITLTTSYGTSGHHEAMQRTSERSNVVSRPVRDVEGATGSVIRQISTIPTPGIAKELGVGREHLERCSGSSVNDDSELGHETSPMGVIAAGLPLDALVFTEGSSKSTSPNEPDASEPLLSRMSRPRGPRPVPSRLSSGMGHTHVRPQRPSIGIPTTSPTAFRSPSSRSSARSPRTRYPQSALASIPEHRLLDNFPVTVSRYPCTGMPTSPLSLHRKRPNSRARSLSDSAAYGRHERGRHDERDGGSGRWSRHSSFIDMD